MPGGQWICILVRRRKEVMMMVSEWVSEMVIRWCMENIGQFGWMHGGKEYMMADCTEVACFVFNYLTNQKVSMLAKFISSWRKELCLQLWSLQTNCATLTCYRETMSFQGSILKLSKLGSRLQFWDWFVLACCKSYVSMDGAWHTNLCE